MQQSQVFPITNWKFKLPFVREPAAGLINGLRPKGVCVLVWKSTLNPHQTLLRQGLSEPEFYGDIVYNMKKIVGSNNFSAQFVKTVSYYKTVGYNINVLQQTACLVVNPITVGNFAFLFNCTPVGRTSDSMTIPIKRLIDL